MPCEASMCDACEIVHVTYHMFVSVVIMANTNDAIM